MAGSQLKQLKAALKANGLTGQTNVRHKGRKGKKAPSDTRRDDRAEVIQRIREEFNPFEVKVNRKKNEVDSRSVKGAQGKPGISKQIGEDQRKAAWEAKKANRNKVGGLRDRRFGEDDSAMTPEEKMLERFTRERQVQSSRNGLYNLNDDDDDEDYGDEGLTHYGKSLAIKDDFQEDDLQDGDDFLRPKKRHLEVEEEGEEGEGGSDQDASPKKKTKAEVMKEVIAKSKFYKEQRQILQEKVEDQIEQLDEDYEDVLHELGSIPKPKREPVIQSNESNGINYEQSVRELNLDRRAAPADRTKTEEEIRTEKAERLKEAEKERQRRMEGTLDVDDGERGPDELGNDDFWIQDSEEEGMSEGDDEGDEDGLSGNGERIAEDNDEFLKPNNRISTPCPKTHNELLLYLEGTPFEDTLEALTKIFALYSPKLQAGNKEKLAEFTTVIFQHVLYLSESDKIESESFTTVQESLIKLLKNCSEKFNNRLVEFLRSKIEEIQERISETLTGQDEYPRPSDLLFFALVGLLYSTSDHYHLVATPSQILMGESLEQLKYNSLSSLVSGLFISNVFIKYQRISRRYVPEVAYFLQKALLSFIEIDHKALSARSDAKFELPKELKDPATLRTLRISDVDTELKDSVSVFVKTISTINLALDIWKEKSAFIEISKPFVAILEALNSNHPNYKPVYQLLQKFKRLLKFAIDERKPLCLQSHRKLAIASYAPKFEENFNPERKSYDENRSRQEISKMRSQLKQERKITMREIRKDTRFEARQQIKEKKAQHQEYHSKMAHILNSINTVEGAEKNAYDRERKNRKNKK